LNVVPTTLDGLVLLEPRVFADARGYFLETWNAARYRALGVGPDFVQDNLSSSTRGVVRGLHLQHPRGQGKLISVFRGEVFDVAVDVRVGSPTFGRWEGVILSAENRRQFFVPPGFAHGYAVTSDDALVAYKCTTPYDPSVELSVRWDDPALAIRWPEGAHLLSPRDAAAPRLAEIEPARLPSMLLAGAAGTTTGT
jgi:dTDP-4-dehydrorhamnose 3,5-epimerase